MIRINKFLSQCGVTSRRGAERLISEGRVTVNGEKIDNLGTLIDPEEDSVKVDNKSVKPVTTKYYILLNKPKFVLTTLTDPFKRKTVSRFVKKVPARVYPVGRLDFDTDGVLLLTNDGELAYRLAHPKYQIEKVYEAIVEGTVTNSECDEIKKGIQLEDGHIGRGSARILSAGLDNSKIEIVMTEGHKREVKQLLKGIGHNVIKLKRVRFAGLSAGNLRWGQWRYLEKKEVETLKKMVGL